MKILFLSKYYNNYLDYFFSSNKFDQNTSYESIYEKIINDRYFWSDYYKQGLTALGYEVEQLIIDAKPLQTQWAKEHQLPYSKENWYIDIVTAQIKHFKPEILFIQDWSQELGSEFIKYIKEQCPFVQVYIGYCGEGHPGPDYFKGHDIVISCAKDNVELFREHGLVAYHIYHGFFPGILDQLGPEPEKTAELGFIGRVHPASMFHRQRALFLGELSQEIPFVIHGEILKTKELSHYRKLAVLVYEHVLRHGDNFIDYTKYNKNKYIRNYLNYKNAQMLIENLEHLRELMEEQQLGLKMFDLVRRYKMLLNIHTSPKYAANLRMFEVTGMGTCLITDWKENIADLYEPDKEIITYRNVNEAKEKIIYLQQNPGVCASIAKAGQERALRDHTYVNRAQDMHNIFNDFLTNKYKSKLI